ncbi:MAG: polynucleotide kinase-phosphatase [Sphingomonadales bacterium]|nr:polynucleotide kinase-phosphatase [Sphingomonadales bacterium]
MINTISIPDYCLVLLVGPSGSGKSTFGARHFLATEIVSSDACRGIVCDDETSLEATGDAFDLVHFIVEKRLAARRLTVVDATNVRPEDRRALVRIAKRYHSLTIAFVFLTPEELCHERNADRPDRQFGRHVVRNHVRNLRRGLGGMNKEGIRFVYKLKTPEEMDTVAIERQPLWTDRRRETGPFDIIGDIHGCATELEALLAKLGYDVAVAGNRAERCYTVTPPDGRRAIFLGDLVDRGPRTPDVLRIVKSMVDAGTALCILGNHDDKLARALKGRNVKVAHGLAQSLAQLEREPDAFVDEMRDFLSGLISHYWFDDGKLVVAHAGIREEMQGRSSGAVRAFCMYGETTGETDEFGLPVRYNWAADYRGRAKVVYGHTPVPEAEWLNGTICIDTGCVFGGKMTALRYPEMELVEVPAETVHFEPTRPLAAATAPALTAQQAYDTQLDIADVIGKRIIATGLRRSVTIHEEQAAAALETMTRFAIDPRWLIHLPPTMSPSETSQKEGHLEHPHEAFAYFRSQDVATVVCEEKHMGSRAIAIVCRDAPAAEKRFGIASEVGGAIYTRTGRRFFSESALEGQALGRLTDALTAADFWKEFESDWVCLDAEIMPWSLKAQALIERQYAPVATAATAGLAQTNGALTDAEARGIDLGDLPERMRARELRADAYREAYGHYVWPAAGIEDIKIAPFHLLASEGAVHADKPHRWHMESLHRLCAADPGLLIKTDYHDVDLADAGAVAEATTWWEDMTSKGGEGMVVKPADFVARGKRGLIQPAVKCRGPEYLRIIYGPDYDAPENLERLRSRGLGKKRSLALREFALGLEALERFVRREPLRVVHECVFGVLALESEPVDPRL